MKAAVREETAEIQTTTNATGSGNYSIPKLSVSIKRKPIRKQEKPVTRL